VVNIIFYIYIITMAPTKGLGILGSKVNRQFLCSMSWKQNKLKDPSDFDKGQMTMARQLHQSISKTAGLVGCLQ